MSTDDGKPIRFPLSPKEVFTRPISALARHRVHQLSDIREVSGSSKAAAISNPVQGWIDGSKDRPQTPAHHSDALSHTTSSEYLTPTAFRDGPRHAPSALGDRAASAISLPMRAVPERRSSMNLISRSLGGPGQASMRQIPTWRIPELDGTSKVIPNRGRAESPVRQSIARAAQSSEILRPSLARTFVRTSPPHEILDNTNSRHPRVELSVSVPSPLFVGGGTVEGHLAIEVDSAIPRKPRTKPIYISKASLDVIGVEEVNDGRRWVFLSLATDLLDKNNPPPPSLVTSQHPQPGPDLWWEMKSATSVLPFCVNLPLKLGPPPYSSKQASIRYLLCPSIVVKIGDKRTVIRQTWNIQMLTVHDPEKALASLPSPLLATDTLYMARDSDVQTVKLTAGLHRQTWVNGGKIFLDVHIANTTGKAVKKIEVQLEKSTLWYTHAPAGTAEKSASYLRLPKRTDAEIVSGTTLKKSSTWKGVQPHSSDVRTLELEAPRGHVTISTGRFFEVRYFINVVVTLKMFKTVAVQLPITIIPINSLDIPPNSVGQVAASIEAKRTKTLPLPPSGPSHAAFIQGQAFEIPLRRSLERARQEQVLAQDDLGGLTNDVDRSPRRSAHSHDHLQGRSNDPHTDENAAPGRHGRALSSHHHLERHASCYHCHIAPENNTPAQRQGPRLPRLQVSTSGLGFSESEFEIPADSPPRKVMMSEEERSMVHRQRELEDRQRQGQRRPSGRRHRKPSGEIRRGDPQRGSKNVPSYNNVVADPNAAPRQPEIGDLGSGRVKRTSNSAKHLEPRTSVNMPISTRSRSKTTPEPPRHQASITRARRQSSPDRQARGRASVDGPAYAPIPRVFSREMGNRASLDQLF